MATDPKKPKVVPGRIENPQGADEVIESTRTALLQLRQEVESDRSPMKDEEKPELADER